MILCKMIRVRIVNQVIHQKRKYVYNKIQQKQSMKNNVKRHENYENKDS